TWATPSSSSCQQPRPRRKRTSRSASRSMNGAGQPSKSGNEDLLRTSPTLLHLARRPFFRGIDGKSMISKNHHKGTWSLLVEMQANRLSRVIRNLAEPGNHRLPDLPQGVLDHVNLVDLKVTRTN